MSIEDDLRRIRDAIANPWNDPDPEWGGKLPWVREFEAEMAARFSPAPSASSLDREARDLLALDYSLRYYCDMAVGIDLRSILGRRSAVHPFDGGTSQWGTRGRIQRFEFGSLYAPIFRENPKFLYVTGSAYSPYWKSGEARGEYGYPKNFVWDGQKAIGVEFENGEILNF